MGHPATIYDTYPRLLDEEYVASYDFAGCWTKNNPTGLFEDLDVAAALMNTSGNLGMAARLLSRSRRSLGGYIARNLQLTELMADLQAEFLDAVEDLHKRAAMNGDLGTQRFFLQTLGKDRGYTTRTETTGKDGDPIAQTLTITPDMPDDLLERLLKAAEGSFE